MKVVYEDYAEKKLTSCTMFVYFLVVEVSANVYLASVVTRYSNSSIMDEVSKVFFGLDEAIKFVDSYAQRVEVEE